jgi:hypothetical protein
MAKLRSGSRTSGLSIRRPWEIEKSAPISQGHDERGVVGTGEPPPKSSDLYRVLGIQAGAPRGSRLWRFVAHARSKQEAMRIGRSLSKLEWSDWKHEQLGHTVVRQPSAAPGVESMSIQALRCHVYAVAKGSGRSVPECFYQLTRTQLLQYRDQLIGGGRRPAAGASSSGGTGRKKKKRTKGRRGV